MRHDDRLLGKVLAICIGMVGATVPMASAQAGTKQGQLVATDGSGSIDLSIPPGQDESITVMGRRSYMLAPLPGGNAAAPGWSGIGPGSKLGPFVVTGGPTNSLDSSGVSAGLALPIAAVKGLEFDAGATGSRDALSPAGTTAAAAVLAGFRLKF